MARWNPPLEIEQVKELALIARLSPHHAESSVLVPSQHRIILSRALPAGFFNGIGPFRKCNSAQKTSAANSLADYRRLSALQGLCPWQHRRVVRKPLDFRTPQQAGFSRGFLGVGCGLPRQVFR